MSKITQERIQEIRNAFRVLGSLTDEELKFFGRVISLTNARGSHDAHLKKRTYEDVTDIIHKLGVKHNIIGYKYLRSAIIFYMKADKKVLMTKELYPAVAKEHNTTSQRVERAIRHAVQLVFEKGNMETVEEVFGTKEVLANGEVIAIISEYLSRKY